MWWARALFYLRCTATCALVCASGAVAQKMVQVPSTENKCKYLYLTAESSKRPAAGELVDRAGDHHQRAHLKYNARQMVLKAHIV